MGRWDLEEARGPGVKVGASGVSPEKVETFDIGTCVRVLCARAIDSPLTAGEYGWGQASEEFELDPSDREG